MGVWTSLHPLQVAPMRPTFTCNFVIPKEPGRGLRSKHKNIIKPHHTEAVRSKMDQRLDQRWSKWTIHKKLQAETSSGWAGTGGEDELHKGETKKKKALSFERPSRLNSVYVQSALLLALPVCRQVTCFSARLACLWKNSLGQEVPSP